MYAIANIKDILLFKKYIFNLFLIELIFSIFLVSKNHEHIQPSRFHLLPSSQPRQGDNNKPLVNQSINIFNLPCPGIPSRPAYHRGSRGHHACYSQYITGISDTSLSSFPLLSSFSPPFSAPSPNLYPPFSPYFPLFSIFPLFPHGMMVLKHLNII